MSLDMICNCEHCQALDRMNALAKVFDDAGFYAAADCCREWGQLASQQNPFGVRLAAAIVRGVYLDGS